MAVFQGRVAPGFEPVAAEFERNFDERGDLGAAVAAFCRGAAAVDLWGGWRDAERTTRWTARTLVVTYSTTKPLAASCALLLVDRGVLDLDAAVSKYWPEFGASGKDGVTVRQLLSHQAGLVALRDPVAAEALFDFARITSLLAAEEPWWEPGSAHGEHALFYGHLVGELVRRVDGRSIGRFFAEDIADPWSLDFHIGLGEEEMARVAAVTGMDAAWQNANTGEPDSMRARGLNNPPGMLDPDVVNGSAWMAAEIPAVNGHGTAMAVARFYQGFLNGGELDGVRVFSEAICREATTVQASGRDLFLDRDVDWGLGFQIEGSSFGHGGLGGSSGYADRELGLAFAYVTNMMADHERGDALADAAERCAAG